MCSGVVRPTVAAKVLKFFESAAMWWREKLRNEAAGRTRSAQSDVCLNSHAL